MFPLPPIPIISFPLAYAETHYRFPYFISFLTKNEPEILFDAPHRISPGFPLPVVLFVKDADKHPCTLLSAHLVIRRGPELIHTRNLVQSPISLTDRWWWTIFDIDVPVMEGWISSSIRFSIRIGSSVRTYATDNYRGTSHAPLRTYVSGDALPTLPGFLTGEAHAHSNYTSDQVEFGLPLPPTKYLSRALGLDFFCMTDHSYDLDDAEDSYLVNDEALPRWKAFQQEAEGLNSTASAPVIVRGEEVSIRNKEGRNVHCLVYGDKMYHPGSGDSAERWLQTRGELDLDELARRADPGAAVFGAHVAEHVPVLQRFLLGRGAWSAEDIVHKRIDGIQFWNGARDRGFEAGRRLWIEALLRGQRCVSLAGNDAHGNFNRFRQLRIPFVSLQDTDRQVFGRVRTSVYTASVSEAAILRSLRVGASVLTDGPLGSLYADDGTMLAGRTVSRKNQFRIRAVSTREFGDINRIVLYAGARGAAEESVVREWRPASLSFESEPTNVEVDAMYHRVEIETAPGDAYGRSHLAMSNPVWYE